MTSDANRAYINDIWRAYLALRRMRAYFSKMPSIDDTDLELGTNAMHSVTACIVDMLLVLSGQSIELGSHYRAMGPRFTYQELYKKQVLYNTKADLRKKIFFVSDGLFLIKSNPQYWKTHCQYILSKSVDILTDLLYDYYEPL